MKRNSTTGTEPAPTTDDNNTMNNQSIIGFTVVLSILVLAFCVIMLACMKYGVCHWVRKGPPSSIQRMVPRVDDMDRVEETSQHIHMTPTHLAKTTRHYKQNGTQQHFVAPLSSSSQLPATPEHYLQTQITPIKTNIVPPTPSSRIPPGPLSPHVVYTPTSPTCNPYLVVQPVNVGMTSSSSTTSWSHSEHSNHKHHPPKSPVQAQAVPCKPLDGHSTSV